MTLPDLSETQWQRQVVDLAMLCRWMVHHCRPAQDQNGRWKTPIQGDPGFPDLVLVRSGMALFIELKTNTATLSTDQQAWRDRLLAAGMDWRCWRPRHWPEVKETLTPAPASSWRLTEDVDTGGRI